MCCLHLQDIRVHWAGKKWYRYREREHWDWGPERTNKSKENDEKNTGLLRGLFYRKTEVAHSSETSVKIYPQYTVSYSPKQQCS
jgi:hypothetical protein